MPESKHTPGPWVVYEECNVETPAGRGIANCGFWRPVRNDHGSSRAENAANARLITAAPDLLRACKAVVANLPDIVLEEMRDIWGNTNTAIIRTALEQAQAAIAKAEGASNA